MNIQTKTITIIISCFVFLVVALSLTLINVTTRSYLELEQSTLVDHLQRTANVIKHEQDTLRQFTGDWAVWDDSYQFINSPTEEFINSNLPDSTFVDNNLAFIIYINRTGKIVYGRAFDIDNEEQVELPSSLIPLLHPDKHLLQVTESQHAIADIISITDGNFLISSYPILTSNLEGPSPGVLVMGRRFGNEFISDIANIIKLDINFTSLGQKLTREQLSATQQLSNKNPYFIKPLNEKNISGYSLINNSLKQPVLLLSLKEDRSIYQQGKNLTTYMIYSIAIIAGILTIVIIILMRSLILIRLLKLSERVNEIQNSQNLNIRIEDSSHDEIGKLSSNINNMLSEMQHVNQSLEKSKLSAEAANNAKTEFLSRINHELRTPLNAIIGFSQVLEIDLEDTASDKIKHDINKITSSGRYLLGLINRLLDLAAIEQRDQKLDITTVNVGESIRNCLSLLSPLADEKGISIIDTTRQYENFIVNADHDALHQIIINLVNNAIKFNKDNGNVSIEYNYTPDNQIAINITDTGFGIPADSYEKIFEPFSRLKTEKNIEGNGIGLALTKNLIELMGGKIQVTSEIDKGCKFCVTLPAQKAA